MPKKDKNGEYKITPDYSDFAQKMNCSQTLITKFADIAKKCSENLDTGSTQEIYAGIYNKYCAVYFYNRRFALSLAFDYFEEYHFVLSVYNDGTETEIYKAISDLGYKFRTEFCYEKELWIDIILDNFLLTCDSQKAADEITEVIHALVTKGIK